MSSCRLAPAPKNASTAASATAALVGLVLAGQRQEDVLVDPAQALQREPLATDRESPVQHGELAAEPGDGGVHLDRPAQDGGHRLRLLRADHRDRESGLMMPALLPAISVSVSPR